MDDRTIWDWESAGLERFIEVDKLSQTIDIDLYSTNYEKVSLASLHLFMEHYCFDHELQSALQPVGDNTFHIVNGWALTERARKTLTGGFFKRQQ